MDKALSLRFSVLFLVLATCVSSQAFAIPHSEYFESDYYDSADHSRFPASEVTPVEVDATKFPYRAIGELHVRFRATDGSVKLGKCVAHLTGDSEITTSAHCKNNYGDQILGMSFELNSELPEYVPKSVPVDLASFRGEYYYRKNETVGGDWAEFDLSVPVGEIVGHFGKYRGHDDIRSSSYGSIGENNDPSYMDSCDARSFPKNSAMGAFRNGINSLLVDNGIDGNDGAYLQSSPRYLRTSPMCMAFRDRGKTRVMNCAGAGIHSGFLVTTCLGRPGLSGSPLYYHDSEHGYVSFGIHTETHLAEVEENSLALSSFHFTGIPSAVSDRAPHVIYGPYTRATVAEDQDDYPAGTSASNSFGNSTNQSATSGRSN